jgi:acetate kinase
MDEAIVVLDSVAWLGVEIDTEANRAAPATISCPTSRVRVAIQPTNEEWIAASHARRALH